MLGLLGLKSLEALADAAVPSAIRTAGPLKLPAALSEGEALARLKDLASRNEIWRSYLGMGYHDSLVPPVIQRNVFENPGWYTAYTPYQAEISQGRLEALLNFQTLIMELTGFDVANASLLDEGTAAAEAMAMAFAARPETSCRTFLAAADVHPQTLAVMRGRAKPLGIEILTAEPEALSAARLPAGRFFGVLVQYPGTEGAVRDYEDLAGKIHAQGGLVVAAADPLALALLRPPAEWGADAAVGTTQRFGVPLGYGGPHAAYFATRQDFRRQMPGRIVGVAKDASGKPALRLALQTREQHIRREKATSNICTAQVLLAVAAGFYAAYHGPEGLRRIAGRVHGLARAMAEGVRRKGLRVADAPFFDTVVVEAGAAGLNAVLDRARGRRINLRVLEGARVGVSLDETTTERDLRDLLEVFGADAAAPLDPGAENIPAALLRRGEFLRQEVFGLHHSETEMLRYIKLLESRDISLTHSMIPLGSCTMKLNAASEMLPLSWPEFSRLHPFAPVEQASGYQAVFRDLEEWLSEITGFAAVSLQPNAGSQGELAGLLVIRRYHEERGQGRRNVCLIPASAHGTNPASAAMAGLRIVPVKCSESGDIDVSDLEARAREHADDLAALMVTYPSTHGVFEENIKRVCEVVHRHGGQVYMDGANMNAQVGLCKPAEIGADVCHLNLHKTFCIPHGGGGPGMGPIGVVRHLAPYLPKHPVVAVGGAQGIAPVSAAPWGSPWILPIPWVYIAQMGPGGLRDATLGAILNANYIARRLEPHYPVLFKGPGGLVAHECILDLRPLKAFDVQVEDVAKRLMDYGFHAPTVSFPVPGTLMVEPTESESKAELDRFCEAMTLIRGEIREIETGAADKADNVLKNAPHTAEAVCADAWAHPYPREKAAYPAAWLRRKKFWPPVGRVDNAYGDRNFICSCS